jgi:hypothetical protein
LKLLLDEMYPSLIARELRTRGHDVVSVHESPGFGTSDEQVLDHARSEGREPSTAHSKKGLDTRPFFSVDFGCLVLRGPLLCQARLADASSLLLAASSERP